MLAESPIFPGLLPFAQDAASDSMGSNCSLPIPHRAPTQPYPPHTTARTGVGPFAPVAAFSSSGQFDSTASTGISARRST